MKRNVLSSALGAALVLFVASASFAEVHFKDLSFDAAKKQAMKEKKKVMVDFYTDWCGWCKVLDRKTYTDEEVGKTADANFISIKINAEKGEGIALAQQFKITGYPTILFISADGKEIDRVVGYQDAGRFNRSLSLAANGGTKAILDEVNGKKEVKDAQKLLVAALFYEQNKDEAKALDLFARAAHADDDNKLKVHEEAAYHIAFLTKGEEQWKAIEEAITQYPMREEGSQATMYLLQHLFTTDHAVQDAGRIAEFWISRHPNDVNVMNFFAWSAAEKGILLDQAEEFATRAIAAAEEPSDRASVMDTRAEILFKKNRVQDALTQEEEAIHLLDANKDKKLLANLQTQKAKFESALAQSGTQDGVVAPSSTSAQ